MIGGEAATRIMLEVLRGVVESTDDSEEEAAYRKLIKKQIDAIYADGGTVDIPKEWL